MLAEAVRVVRAGASAVRAVVAAMVAAVMAAAIRVVRAGARSVRAVAAAVVAAVVRARACLRRWSRAARTTVSTITRRFFALRRPLIRKLTVIVSRANIFTVLVVTRPSATHIVRAGTRAVRAVVAAVVAAVMAAAIRVVRAGARSVRVVAVAVVAAVV